MKQGDEVIAMAIETGSKTDWGGLFVSFHFWFYPLSKKGAQATSTGSCKVIVIVQGTLH